ncbi:MAG: hypothetical protein IPO92_00335 [Saprospiraceae bacterium]|nr:hypothetical protein [Saprospiraceae bacterium]
MKNLFSVYIFSALFLTSCYYDSVEDLYPASECITVNVSFSQDIQPILVNNCLTCHTAASTIGGGINLEGHEAVLFYANSGSLVGSVKQSAPYSAMPKSAAKLEACKILKIESWVQAGSPNN